ARARMSSLNGTMNFCVARGMATSLSCKFALRLAHLPEPNGLSSAPAWWIWAKGLWLISGRGVPAPTADRGVQPGLQRIVAQPASECGLPAGVELRTAPT